MIDWDKEILLIDKPVGITSFDVIRRLRILYSKTHNGLKAPKMGHAGTLDPLATGLMVIGVGKGTRRLTNLTKLDKEYIAEIRLGESRITGDLEGEVVAEKEVIDSISNDSIDEILTSILGNNVYTVSAYSAIKKDGVPMYKRARKAAAKGETVEVNELPKREMKVDEAKLLSVEDVVIDDKKRIVATVQFKVGSGTYIRSLAEVVGEKLGYPACLQALRRTKVGEFLVEDAVEIPEIK